jgi:hypothetical protein
MRDIALSAPDHMALSQHTNGSTSRCVACPSTTAYLIVDSTGFSIAGEGEWVTSKRYGHGPHG